MENGKKQQDWLVAYKKRIITGIIAILTVTITATMFFIVCTVRSKLLQESTDRARELGTVLSASLSHLMETQDSASMQETLLSVRKKNPAVVRTFILDNRGRIAFSTHPEQVGTVLDRAKDASCTGCHGAAGRGQAGSTLLLTIEGRRVQRYVHVIENEPACHRCHPAGQRINGKLIIDRSLEGTDALVAAIIVIISGLGVLSLAVLIPFLWRLLSRGVNTYITEIRLKSAELQMLYSAVERLSTTIELEALKRVIIEIVTEATGADEVDMVLPSEYKEIGATVWSRKGASIERTKVAQDSRLHGLIQRWTSEHLDEHEISGDGREIAMPVSKGGTRLALIVARSKEEQFSPAQLPLIKAMAKHIAVAFENAILYHIAITDELTALYTNRHFRQTVLKRYALFHEYAEKTALLMVDIDNFKRINDTYGHPAGDAILKDVGKCIMSSIREDDMAFRYGGEEFAVVLPASDETAGRAVAERMRTMIENYPFRTDQHVLQITVSIGVSAWPISGENVKELILQADKGLYEAKNGGKNRVVVRGRE